MSRKQRTNDHSLLDLHYPSALATFDSQMLNMKVMTGGKEKKAGPTEEGTSRLVLPRLCPVLSQPQPSWFCPTFFFFFSV